MPTLKPSRMVLAFAFGLSVTLGPFVSAQTTADTLQSSALLPDSTNLLAAIATYPNEVRQAALWVAQHPQVLTQLAQQQLRSQQSFDNLIQHYGQNKKSWFYDVARFPGALHALAQLPRKSKGQSKAIIQTLPVESQRPVWKLFRHHHAELAKADSMNQQAEHLFDSLVTPLTMSTQRAFRQLLTLPDLLTLLTQQINATTRLSKAYQTDSVGIVQQLTSLHDRIRVQNQHELADYTRELGEDLMAQQELQLAGQAYAQTYGYPSGLSSNPASPDSSLYDNPNPYSFWFGYPSWYSVPLWYPSTSWYSTGYGYGPGGNLAVFGFPSPSFITWFFTRGFRAYPHLCERFNAYYDRTTSRHRYWTTRDSGLLLATHRHFGSFNNDWRSHSNWLTRPRHYSHTTNVTGSNVSIWTSSPRHRYHTPSRSWSRSTQTHSSSRSHHSGSSHSGGYHGGGSHSHGRGPR